MRESRSAARLDGEHVAPPFRHAPRLDRRGPGVVRGEHGRGPDVSVVVVTHDSARVVGDCLAALPAALARYRYEVLVVDNASRDASVDVVTGACPPVKVLRNRRNTGFAAANNRAFACARGRYLLLLNPDTVAAPGSLDGLLDAAEERPRAGVLAPRLVNPDGSDQRTARRFPTPAAALLGRRSPLTRWFPDNRWSQRYLAVAEHDPERPFEVDWVSGACMLVPTQILAAVGGLDAGYFLYWEDADWCRRIKARGYGVVCIPTAEVVHHEGAARLGWPARRVWRFHRAAYRYYRIHHLAGPARILRPAAALALLARATVLVAVHTVAAGRRRARGAA